MPLIARVERVLEEESPPPEPPRPSLRAQLGLDDLPRAAVRNQAAAFADKLTKLQAQSRQL